MSHGAHRGRIQKRAFGEEVHLGVADASAGAWEGGGLLQKGGNSLLLFFGHLVWSPRSFGYVCFGVVMQADRRVATLLCLEERLALVVEMTCGLVGMLVGVGGPPAYFDSHHLLDIYLAFCIHRRTHGFVCSQ